MSAPRIRPAGGNRNSASAVFCFPKAANAGTKYLSVGSTTIVALRKNPVAKQAFPFLNSIPSKTIKSCGGCGGSGTTTELDYNWAKLQIVELKGEQLKKLKSLLNAEHLLVSVFQSGALKTHRL